MCFTPATSPSTSIHGLHGTLLLCFPHSFHSLSHFFFTLLCHFASLTPAGLGQGGQFWQLRNVNFTANLIYWLHAEWLAMDV